MSKRPENIAPPEIFYNESEARKYTSNSRMIEIQVKLCERAIELLLLPEDQKCLLLDIGCGSGLSGNVISNEGHHWIGIDISPAMLEVARDEETEGDVLLNDMGQGVPFKAGTFDGAISISALQWLFNEDLPSHHSGKRISNFFNSLYSCLSRNARAVLQFYPGNDNQVEILKKLAEKAGFYGGVLVDYPNSKKARKFYLVLTTGSTMVFPKALEENQRNSVQYTAQRMQLKNKRNKLTKNSKQWILNKKERNRRKGKETCADSKYTGRRRKHAF